MNTYNKIHKLLEWEWLINKELSFGCELISKKTGDKLIFIRDLADVLLLKIFEWTYNTVDNLKKHCEIIWHPPTEMSILRYLWQDFTINSNGELKSDMYYWSKIAYTFDLTKKLSEQDNLDKLLLVMEYKW